MLVRLAVQDNSVIQMYHPNPKDLTTWAVFPQMIMLAPNAQQKIKDVEAGMLFGFWVDSDTGQWIADDT